MKNPLNKRFKRDLIKNLGVYLSLSLAFIAIVSIIGSFLVVGNSSINSYNEYVSNNNQESGNFTVKDNINSDLIKDLNNDDITIIENFYFEDNISDDVTIRVYSPSDLINIPLVIKGYLPTNNNEIALDRLFSLNNNLKIDDKIYLNDKEYIIKGLIGLPNYTSLFYSNSDLLYDSFHFGVGVISNESLSLYHSDNLVRNYSYKLTTKDISESDINKESNKLLDALISQGITLLSFTPSISNQNITYYSNDLGTDKPLFLVMGYISLTIMILIFIIITNNTINNESKTIGTLFSLGYKRNELVFHYSFIFLIISFFSAIVGTVLSYTVFTGFFKRLYQSAYSIPDIIISFDIEALLFTTIIPLILIIVIVPLIIGIKLNKLPSFYLKNLNNQKSKNLFKKKLHLSFINRFKFRVLIQNSGGYLILMIGIFFANFILALGMSLIPMINNYSKSLKDASISPYQYVLFNKSDDSLIKDSEIFGLEEYNYKVDKDNLAFSVYMYGIKGDTSYLNKLPIQDDQIILSSSLSKKLNLKVNNKISLYLPYSTTKREFIINEIYDYPTFAIFTSLSNFNLINNKPIDYYNGIFSQEELSIDESNIALKIVSSDNDKIGDQMLSTFGSFTPFCFAISIIFHLIIMFILTKMVIDKNKKNISLLKILGYESNEINKVYITPSILVVVLSSILSIPFVYLIMKLMINLIFAKISGYMETYIPIYVTTTFVVVTIVTYLLINISNLTKIKKVDSSLILKSIE